MVYCPFFTDGDYPPLGLACINGALHDDGHETSCFDFSWYCRKYASGEFHLVREFFAVGRVKDEVVFALAPELGLFLLYGEDVRSFKWHLPYEAEFKPAAVALCLSLWSMVPKWAEMVLARDPEAVLFSTYSSNIFTSLYLAKHLRRLAPSLPIIFGGPGTGLPDLHEFILATGLVDALVSGEGEITVRELCKNFARHLGQGLPGLAVLKGRQVKFQPRELARDLDALPRASFEGLPFPGENFSAYKAFNQTFDLARNGFPLYSTRGCVNRCAYCSESAYWQKFRQRRVESVLAEIQTIHDRYGETRFIFNDSALNGNPSWLEQLCSQEGRLDFKPALWSYLIPNSSINPKMTSSMSTLGFDHVTLGVETFSASIRQRILKKMDGDQVFQSILALTRAGINVTANVLVGFPGESDEEFESSISYMEKWGRLKDAERGPGKVFWQAGHRVRVEAYSRFYRSPERWGIKISPYEIPLPPELDYLKPPLSRILFRASHSVDEKTFHKRSSRMKKLASRLYKP